MTQPTNPILRGFNPDPSIIRVGEDYYIATSTFEWFPGVQIHHSRDLVHWELVARPLNRVSQLDLRGHPDSCGVWAPCLSYDDGTFYLVYSNVKTFDGPWLDSPNYLVTTKDILGDWSDPIFLSASGFDGSLFHDDDGRKWYTSMLYDHRESRFFGGLIMQEYDPVRRQLAGPVHRIFEGTALGKTEGPHLYRRNGFYYLIAAEGGTEYGHAVTMARSQTIEGPYEVHPANPIISSADAPQHALQKAGHADLVETPDGDWFAVFLVGRPLSTHGRCILGRETAIEPMVWKDDDWLYTKSGEQTPTHWGEGSLTKELDNFEGSISKHFQSLRAPISSEWLDLESRSGFVRLYGRESLSSLFSQSLIARRIQHFQVEVTTCLDFAPASFQQMAGLVFYYNTQHFHYLHLTADDAGNRQLVLITVDKHQYIEHEVTPVPAGGVWLRGHLNRDALKFTYSVDGAAWQDIGGKLDASILSDDYVRDEGHTYRPAFTGAFVGICCQDLTGKRCYADFDWFKYEEYE
ncbi:MAG: glycoside hydrolase family 43 protein [Bacteroidota bacterium]